MKKAVDITERTLEKEKKSFTESCSFWAKACKALMVIMAIVGGYSVLIDLFVLKPETILTAITNGIYVITNCIGLNFGSKIFKSLKTGETPFRYDIADKIKGAGQIMVGGGALCFFMEILVTILDSFKIIGAYEMLNMTDGGSALIAGGALLMIAYIFNYGCKLQQESDETI